MSAPTKEPFYYNDLFIILNLFCCWPLGLILMWTGNKWSKGLRIGISICWGFMVLIAGVGVVLTAPQRGAQVASSNTSTRSESPEPRIQNVKETCSELSTMFGRTSKLSEVQKQDLWNDYRGKRFSWSLKVNEVHEGLFGRYTVQYKCTPKSPSLLYDILVEYPASTKIYVLKLKKGSTYEVSGTLKETNTLVGISTDVILD